MTDIANIEVLEVLLALLPGFLTAELVGILVLRKERTVPERLIQALIYTFLCHVLWSAVSWAVPDNPTIHLLGLGICAVLWGLAITWAINGGKIHRYLRKIRLTQAQSRPSEWYDAFYRTDEYVVLHLKDGRRLYGWPKLYPQDPERGHFWLTDAQWLDLSASTPPPRRVSCLIPVTDVEFVEFVSLKPKESEND